MIVDKKSYGLIVLDRSEATIGILTGKKIITLKNFDSLVPRKHRQGGQSAQRFERLIEIAAHEYFKKIGDSATEAFLDKTGDLLGILIGGPGATKDFFVKEGYLHHELQKKVVDTFDTGYTDEYGLKELVETAKDAITDMDLTREKDLIQRLLAEIRKADGGLAAYGEDEVRHMVEMGAVDTLLLSEGLKLSRLTLRCGNGHVTKVTQRTNMEKIPACQECDSPTELVESMDLVDELFELAATMSSKVELISEDSEEGELLLRAFGGIAALLRFRAG
jgi:peptide chain release factor subunit 1